MFRKVNPAEQALIQHLDDDAQCDNAGIQEPPLRLYTEHQLPKSLFDHQSVNGEMHKDVRQVITPTAARSEQLNGPAPGMLAPPQTIMGGQANHLNNVQQ